MHISEGILNAPVLLTGAAVGAAGVAIGLRRVRQENLCETALLSAAFFVASLVHVPVFGASAHLVLNGLLGLILGWAAFPAIFVALVLQAFLFQFGGVTTLGLNTVILAAPAVMASMAFANLARSGGRRLSAAAGAMAGAMAVGLSGLLAATALWLGGEGQAFAGLAGVILAAHIPIMLVEAAICGSAVVFLRQAYPQLLDCRYAPQA